jgi:hypothetical protein
VTNSWSHASKEDDRHLHEVDVQVPVRSAMLSCFRDVQSLLTVDEATDLVEGASKQFAVLGLWRSPFNMYRAHS